MVSRPTRHDLDQLQSSGRSGNEGHPSVIGTFSEGIQRTYRYRDRSADDHGDFQRNKPIRREIRRSETEGELYSRTPTEVVRLEGSRSEAAPLEANSDRRVRARLRNAESDHHNRKLTVQRVIPEVRRAAIVRQAPAGHKSGSLSMRSKAALCRPCPARGGQLRLTRNSL